ncbi:MAG TPA: hypothetical protein PLI70_07560 [Gemmatimonadales bacterium]|nr:hypothetical protein [Gemmatimonadales bacterium]HRZ09432.1 hypothetical protein [Gemmatimonadales bacterium]
MAAPLFLALMLIQGPTTAAQATDGPLVLSSNPVPVLARGIQVQSDRAPASAASASGGPVAVTPAPCVYYTYIAGAEYCSLRALRNGTIIGGAREDYLLWQVQHDIAKEMEIRVRAAVRANESRRLEAQRTQPASTRSSAAGTSQAGSGSTTGQPRSAGTSSNFSGGMYTPAPRNSTGGGTTKSSAPAKRGQLQ